MPLAAPPVARRARGAISIAPRTRVRAGISRDRPGVRGSHLRANWHSPQTGEIGRRSLLDRQVFRTFDAAADGLIHFAAYYNYDRLHGELDWHTPAERFDGTPFTARGFERVPALDHLQGWLAELMPA